MGAVGQFLCNAEGDRLCFRCPGCHDTHAVRVGDGPSPRWTYNGNADAPTFQPSVLVRCGHYAQGVETPTPEGCWCTYNAEHPDDPAPFKCYRCHSFVIDGMIQFLADCTHELAGKTVPMVEFGP